MLLSLLFNAINIVSIVHLANTIGNMYFPETTNRVRQYIMWEGLKVYTIVNKYIRDYKAVLFNCSFVEKEDLHFIRDGKTVLSCKSALFDRRDSSIPEFDFILHYINYTSNNEKYDYNVLRIINVDGLDIENKFTPSPVKFLGIKIVIDNISQTKSDPIDINFGKANYYMNLNILFDRPFIKYYLNKFHGIELKESEGYEIKFIDDEMKVVTITDEHYIELYDNTYKIRLVRT